MMTSKDDLSIKEKQDHGSDSDRSINPSAHIDGIGFDDPALNRIILDSIPKWLLDSLDQDRLEEIVANTFDKAASKLVDLEHKRKCETSMEKIYVNKILIFDCHGVGKDYDKVRYDSASQPHIESFQKGIDCIIISLFLDERFIQKSFFSSSS